MFALILPAGKAELPYIRETVATPMLGRTPFKAEAFTSGISGGGSGVLENVAEVNKMLLSGGPLFQLHLAPLCYELRNGHVRYDGNRAELRKQE